MSNLNNTAPVLRNASREVWEGWTVGRFVSDLLFSFNIRSKNRGWTSEADLKAWVKSEQPYMKKAIPEVQSYFVSLWRFNKKEEGAA